MSAWPSGIPGLPEKQTKKPAWHPAMVPHGGMQESGVEPEQTPHRGHDTRLAKGLRRIKSDDGPSSELHWVWRA